MGRVTIIEKYSETQPRDDHGRFSSGGGAGAQRVQRGADEEQHRRLDDLVRRVKQTWDDARPVLGTVAALAGDALLGLALAAVAARFKGPGRAPGGAPAPSPIDRVKAEHGVRAARILALYLRPGTAGEKAAAAAALRRMGIDVERYAKRLIKAGDAWALLDHLLTEDQASEILEAMLNMMNADEADSVLTHGDSIMEKQHPWDESKHPRGQHGQFASGAGGAEPPPGLSASTADLFGATGDLLTRLGSTAYDVGALIHSARALRNATTRGQIAIHVTVIASTILALKTHFAHLPEEARIWSEGAVETLQQTKEMLLKLKAKIFRERNNDNVNKIAFEMRSIMVGATA
jgi:hypothetical protein